MAVRREEIHKLVEVVPEDKLTELKKIICKMTALEEDEPTKEEREAIKQAMKEYENGETYTFDEIFGEDNV